MILAVLAWKFYAEIPIRPLEFIGIQFGVYISYMLGLLGMYLFSMPEGTLGSFARYESCIRVLLWGGNAVYSILIINNAKLKDRGKICLMLITLLLFVAGGKDNGSFETLFVFPKHADQDTLLISSVMEENPNQRAIVYTGASDSKWQLEVAKINYYYYNKPYRIVSNRSEGTDSIEHWRDWNGYLFPVVKDEYYLQYAKEAGINPDAVIVYKDNP